MHAVQIIILVSALLIVGCSTPDLPSAPSAMPPNYQPVPDEIINDLPRRMAELPVVNSMPKQQFLMALGLSDYDFTSDGGIRFNSTFHKLNPTHTLQVRYTPESFAVTVANIDHIINGTAPITEPTNPTGKEWYVVGCSLRNESNEVVASRVLVNALRNGR